MQREWCSELSSSSCLPSQSIAEGDTRSFLPLLQNFVRPSYNFKMTKGYFKCQTKTLNPLTRRNLAFCSAKSLRPGLFSFSIWTSCFRTASIGFLEAFSGLLDSDLWEIEWARASRCFRQSRYSGQRATWCRCFRRCCSLTTKRPRSRGLPLQK